MALVLLPLAISATTGMALASTGSVIRSSDPAAQESKAPVASTVNVQAKRHVRRGRVVAIKGQVRPGGRRSVTVLAGGRKVAATKTASDGRFRVRWVANRTGSYRIRAIAGSTTRAKAARGRTRRKVNVYRAAQASYYGPGLYGNGTACGKTLTPGTKGVAHKSMPCGTKLTLRYGRRTVRVRVIDRGPYSGNREFDLTAATKRKLGFPSTGSVLTTR